MHRAIRCIAFAVCLLAVGSAGTAWADGPPPGFPENLRWSLVPKWIEWIDSKAQIAWPPNDGCAAAPQSETLPPGTIIDRYGSEGGTFFSPRGAAYTARAVPYVCGRMDYRVYRVVRPLTVKECRAAPWFDEPGGAEQLQTGEPAYKLKDAGMIEMVSYEPAGSGSAASRCGVR